VPGFQPLVPEERDLEVALLTPQRQRSHERVAALLAGGDGGAEATPELADRSGCLQRRVSLPLRGWP
jgi:hypothetical protein